MKMRAIVLCAILMQTPAMALAKDKGKIGKSDKTDKTQKIESTSPLLDRKMLKFESKVFFIYHRTPLLADGEQKPDNNVKVTLIKKKKSG